MLLVQKTLKFSDVELKMDAETGKFCGYASVFGGKDSYGDTMLKGAFAETLKDSLPKMFFNHEWTMPIGKWTVAKEDDKGLWVEGELTPGLGIAADVRAAMKHGTLDGLSIGGYLKKGDYEETEDGRTITKWSKLMEVSPVVFPADSNARIESVKSIDFESLLPECDSEKDIERLLRDAGLSKGQATAIVSRVRAILKGRDAHESQNDQRIAEVLARLEKFAS